MIDADLISCHASSPPYPALERQQPTGCHYPLLLLLPSYPRPPTPTPPLPPVLLSTFPPLPPALNFSSSSLLFLLSLALALHSYSFPRPSSSPLNFFSSSYSSPISLPCSSLHFPCHSCKKYVIGGDLNFEVCLWETLNLLIGANTNSNTNNFAQNI